MLPSILSLTGTNRVAAFATLGPFSILLEARDVDSFYAVVLAEFESIQIELANDLDCHIVFMKERMLGSSERRDRDGKCLRRC